MSANEEFEIIQHGLADIAKSLDEIKEESEASELMGALKVAMKCLQILSASQKYTTITKVTGGRGGGFSEGGGDEHLTETIHRYPRPLDESEQGLRDVCCQFLAGYFLNAVGCEGPDGVDEGGP